MPIPNTFAAINTHTFDTAVDNVEDKDHHHGNHGGQKKGPAKKPKAKDTVKEPAQTQPKNFKPPVRVHHDNKLIPGCVTVFAENDFKGQSKTICSDSPALRGFWNNKISSIKVGRRTEVTLFEDYDFKGKSVTIKHEQKSLGKFDNVASALKLKVHPQKKGEKDDDNKTAAH